MRKRLTGFLIVMLCGISSFAQVKVTFQVDMNQITINAAGVHLAGNFQGWSPSTTAMTKGTGTIYSVTLSLPKDSTYQFKFLNGNAWGEDEAVPVGCATGGNRTATIATNDTTLPAFCYNSCAPCVYDSANVTFQVDMKNETVSDSGVHIAGNFQGWSPASSLMTKGSGTVYSLTFRIPANTSYQYKFINGPSWPDNETVPAGCSISNNRGATIAGKDTTLPAFCFGSCTVCAPPPPPGDSVNVTFEVNMQNVTVSDTGVHVAGNFQGWNKTSSLMTEVGKTSVYTITFKLPEDSTIQFKFLNGVSIPDWETVPKACGFTNSLNREITIGTKDTTLPAFCFGSCTVCAPPPPPPDSVNVTFEVNMQNVTVSDSGVHVAGNFQGWNKTSSLMIEVGKTSVYTITFKLPEDSTVQFKFLNGVSIPDWETVPKACGFTNSLNREITIGAKDTTLPAFCFSSCTVCAPPPPPVDSVNVTFQVNMQNQTVSDSGVHIAGNFEGWSPSKSVMTKGSGTIYSATFKIPADSTIQFKFINGPSWPDNETVPAPCVTAGNRSATIATKDTTLPAFCFGSCTVCVGAPPPPDSVNVTFEVNMEYQTVSDSGVHIAGNFQGWNKTSSLMTEVGNTPVYTITFRLPEDSTLQFKFLNGVSIPDWETVPKACGFTNSLNREVTVGTRDTILAPVCFSSCSICPGPAPVGDSVNVTFRVNMQYQTVSDTGVHVAGSFQGWSKTSSPMTEVGTTSVYTITFRLPEDSTLQFKFLNGTSIADWETVPKACGFTNSLNREITIGTKDTILPAFCFSSCTVCPAPPPPPDSVNVTFQVNMEYQTVSDSGVHIAGNFQGWNKTSSPMTEVGNTPVYTITFRLPEDSTLQFKFLNGVSIPDWETVPKACGFTNSLNREVTVGTKDTTLPAFCFSSCTVCLPPPPPVDSVNVTFQVNMEYQTVSDSGVHIAGNFQGWSPSASAMTKGSGSIYSITVRIPEDSTYQFKFINGPTWPDNETVPAPCVTGGNRTATIGTKDTTLPAFCFSSCTVCPVPPPPGDSVNVTFKVDMSQQTVSANGVHLAGSFQGWNPASLQMSPAGAGVYSVTVRITADTTFQYKFVNGNAWGTDETVPTACATNMNRGVTLTKDDTTLAVVCFGSCTVCPPPVPVNVTFQVDMGTTTPSANGIHIIGSFQGFDPTATQMVKMFGTSVYQVTVALASGDSVQYKFVNGNTTGNAENPPAECTVKSTGDRAIVVPSADYTTPLVCFASCSPCVLGISNVVDEKDIIVYPSPAKDYFTIQMGAYKEYTMSIYDSEGRLVKQEVLNNTVTNVSLDNFSSGVYTIRMMNSNDVVVKKIMVTK